MNIGQEPHSSALGAWRTAIPKQFPDYRPHLILRNHAELHVEQRIWLRKREIPGSCARAPRKGLIIQAGTGTPAPNKERLFPPHG